MADICASPAAITPDSTTVNQIYAVVNEIFAQTTGNTELSAVDTNSLVAMGTTLDNLGKLDIWLNSLVRRIGLTVDGYRVYENDFADIYRNELEWGAIVQKLYVNMPEAKEDLAYKVGELDGQSIDQWIINNPKADQIFFDKETPYSFYITIQDFLLREAFLGAGGMQNLINYIFGQVRNRNEHTLENLGRYALANLGVNIKDAQIIPLLTLYNTDTGESLTAKQALNEPKFLGFAIATIYKMSDMMSRMSVLFNQVGRERFTPKSKQKLYMLGDFDYKLGTVGKAYAYNKEYLDSPIKAKMVPYWNAIKGTTSIAPFETVSAMAGTTIAGTEKTVNNVIAMLVDYDAFGTFRKQERVATTPLNARGLYYNTFWHERPMYFNDLSENAILFVLA